MFSMIKNFGRPFMTIGKKMGKIFGIGKKTHLVSDTRNLEKFEDLARPGLRQRSERSSDMLGADKAFYGNMEGYLSSFKYPV